MMIQVCPNMEEGQEDATIKRQLIQQWFSKEPDINNYFKQKYQS